MVAIVSERELSLESVGERSEGERVIKYRRLKPIRTGEMKVLLLENVSKVAHDMFTEAGFQVNNLILTFRWK